MGWGRKHTPIHGFKSQSLPKEVFVFEATPAALLGACEGKVGTEAEQELPTRGPGWHAMLDFNFYSGYLL